MQKCYNIVHGLFVGLSCLCVFVTTTLPQKPYLPPFFGEGIVLYDTDMYTCAVTIDALEKIGTSAVPALIADLESTERVVQLCAAVALWRIEQHGAAVPALITVLDDANAHSVVRRNTAQVLGEIGSLEAVPTLLNALWDVDRGVREGAACALGEIGALEAVSALIITLGDVDKDVRRGAAQALLHIGTPEALAALREHGFGHLIDEESSPDEET